MKKLTKLPEPKISFIACLSNGEIAVENKTPWEWIDNSPSPWNRLIRYAAKKKVNITSVSLLLPNGKTLTLPLASGKSRFIGYANITPEEKPLDFEVKRYLERAMQGTAQNGVATIEKVGIREFYTIAEAIYKDFTLQLWVSELGDLHSYVVIKKHGN